MEIVNRKEIKLFVISISLFSIIAIIIPLFYYCRNFNGNFSILQSDWGAFGDYIGGVIGTLLNFTTLCFSLISIYITLRITTRIQKFEADQNTKNDENENNRFNKQIELTKKQNKPLPFLQLVRFPNKTEIVICNYGIGPLIITNWELKYKNDTYANFDSLLSKLKNINEENEIDLLHNTSKNHVIAPGKERILFSIESKRDNSKVFQNLQTECRSIFEKTEIRFEYEDIFENKNIHLKTLNFLKN